MAKWTKEYEKIYKREWYKKNKVKISKQSKSYYVIHKDKILENVKKYALENKKRIKIYKKQYANENKEKIRIYKRNYMKEKYHKNINFKVLSLLRSRIYSVLKNRKFNKTVFLIGCEIAYLMYHLQVSFKPGMSWDNYGKGGWEIDHIKPCAKFDLSKLEEQKKCFHYTNLQPLWEKENLYKGATYE